MKNIVKIKTILYFIAFVINIIANAQPGYVDINRNIDDLTIEDAIANKENPSFYKLTIVIDSTSSDFSKLNFLKQHKHLTFNIKKTVFPKAFNEIIFDSIQQVTFLCNDVVIDIKNIKGFKKATELHFNNFSGKKLPSVLTEFEKLEFLNLENAKKLQDVKILRSIKNLSRFILNCSNLNFFPRFKENRVKAIELIDLSKNTNLTNLQTLDSLLSIKFDIATTLEEIPTYLSKNLINIRINGNINTIANLKIYPNLQHLNLENTQLQSFDVNLKESENLNNIHLKQNKKMTDISGIYTCKNLEYLLISGLPMLKEFHFKNLNLKSGLTIQYSGVTKIEPMKKIYELGYLYLTENNYLDINLDPVKSKWTVRNNGQMLLKDNE